MRVQRGDVLDIRCLLSEDLPAWSTRTRFHARLVEREGVVVLTGRVQDRV